ncbi:MAG: NAD(P)/FAD-dependent oxidoreductase [Candidatus Promineifilaceae bacterium]|nr:NAD(P)/FAD-dependent oxidoreductase [Candidatus Promineifilaceae bacterium]
MSDYDVIIVGARIAGSVLASHLGDRGHRVLLLDRDNFPSDTLSTHFFRAPAIRTFDAIGVLDEVEADAPRLTVDYNVIDDTVFPEPVDEPEDYPYYLCVRRITLDHILVCRAQGTASVEMREGAVATGLLWEDGCCVGVKWRDKESGDRLEARARAVIGADGVRSTLARKVDPEVEDERPIERAMYYGYYRNVPAKDGPAAEFHYLGNQLVYCIPTNDDLTLLAASVPIEEFDQFRSDPEGELVAVLKSMTALAPRLAEMELEGPVRGTGAIPCFRRVPYGRGWALVGDAGMTLDPWSGQGIDQASTHATMLADQLDAFLTEESDWDSTMKAYHQARNEFSRKVYRQTANFAPDLRPMTRKALERRGLA